MTELQPPNKIPKSLPKNSIFLGGTIDMGTGELWQNRVIEEVMDTDGIILNPRRCSWNKAWKQDDSDPNFIEQVEWELEGQEKARQVVYFFAEKSKSPITLLELGLFRHKKPLVFCPRGFYRFGNVQIVCRHYSIPHFEKEKDWINALKNTLL